MKNTIILTIAILTALTLTGCAKQQEIKIIDSICITDATKAEIFDAAEKTLGDMYFRIAKVDTTGGYISTKPLPAAQAFEFWRKDNVDKASFAEANIHSLRRTVQMHIKKQKQQTCLTCDVLVERLSLAPQKGTDYWASSTKFEPRPVSDRNLKLLAEQQMWIKMPNDKKLATVILNEINLKFKNPK